MEISIADESQRFLDFMNEENNNNIIFSGVYGIGKSYFINDFFNIRHKDEYFTLFITPVNYSVASNEDIFEYIKANILLQLLEKTNCNLVDINISDSVAAFYYIKKNLNEIFVSILSLVEKTALKTDVLSILLKLKKNIQQYRKNESMSENEEIESFISEIAYKKGSIYESNFITQLIQSIISNIKTEKEVVLVIDDLDRIDPEHIFRILNVLSAHEDFGGTKEHKFNIGKTILVCDIENIRKIFHSRYGADVDFTGYIDKFYSKEIFHFNNEEEILKCIASQVLNIKTNSPISKGQSFAYHNFVFIMQNLIKYGYINIRTIEKLSFDYNIDENKTVSYNGRIYRIINYPAMSIFEILKRIAGSTEALKNLLLKLSYHKVYININAPFGSGFPETFIILADLPNNTLQRRYNKMYKGLGYNFDKNNPGLLANIEYKPSYKVEATYFGMLYEAFLNYDTYFI